MDEMKPTGEETKPPWEIAPALKPERLLLLDRTVRRVREDVVRVTNEKGDDKWVVGCRAYKWLWHALKEMYLSGEHPWLVVQVGMYLNVRVEGVPIRIYSGNPEGQPYDRQLQAGLRELEKLTTQRELFENEYGDACLDPDGWFWMMAVDTDELGRVLRTGVLQAHEAAIEPRDDAAIVLAPRGARRAYKPRNVYIIDEQRLSNLVSMTPTRNRPVSQSPIGIGVRQDQPGVAKGSNDEKGS